MEKAIVYFGFGVVIAAVVAGLWALQAFIVMLAWNYVAAAIFGCPEVNFWTAGLAMTALSIVAGMFKMTVNSAESK